MTFYGGEQKHEAKPCPRCGQEFICKPGDIANCQCHSLQLLPATLAFLRKTQYDCLCGNCLSVVNEMVLRAQQDIFPVRMTHLQETIHFYRENSTIVFTEYYHLLRGYCCRNGCRHCAYGYEKKQKGCLGS